MSTSRQFTPTYASDSDSNSDSDSPPPPNRFAAPSRGGRREKVTISVEELEQLTRAASVTYTEEAPGYGMRSGPRGCRGLSNGGGGGRSGAPVAVTCALLGCPDGCECAECPQCQRRKSRRRRHNRRHPHPSLRPSTGWFTEPNGTTLDSTRPNGALGPIKPTAAYLKGASVASQSVASDHPLIVLSLEGVLGCHLPSHLAGGHTNVLSRMYLETLMDYLLLPSNTWSIAFWSGSMKRTEAMQVLKWLKLPTGSAETDERDGVMGLWSAEDLRHGWDGGELGVKDLEVLWAELYKEEGVQWSLEDTVVLTANPDYCLAQPYNFILAPSFTYKSPVRAWDDQFLLALIAALEDLTSESNFAAYIKDIDWNSETFWIGPKATEMDFYVHTAVKVCAKKHIVIKGGGGN